MNTSPMRTGEASAERWDAPRRATPGFGAPLVGALIGLVLWLGTFIGSLLVDPGPHGDPTVTLIIWLNVTLMLGVLAIEVTRRPYSLHLMHLIALFLFLGAPALLQYTRGIFAVAGPINLFRAEILPAVIAVLLYVLTYVVSYEASHRLARTSTRGPVAGFLSREVTPIRMNVVMVVGVVVLVYLALVMGLSGVTTRAGAREAAMEFAASQRGILGPGKAFYLINHLLLRAFPLVVLAGGLQVLRRYGALRQPLLLALFVVLSVGIFFGNNPFAGSRIWFVTFLFGMIAPLAFARLRTGWGVVVTAVAGLTLLPALAANRHAQSFNEWLDWFRVVSPLKYLSQSTDVDSLGMLVLCVSYTLEKGHTWGMQILSGLLSWFPRALWSGKSIGTGKLVTESLGFEFTNLAPPVVAEAVVDFGLLGVPILACALGLLFSKLDRLYWAQTHEKTAVTRVIDVMYPFWLGLMVLLTRGDLISAVTFILAFSFWVVPLGVGGSRPTAAAQSMSTRSPVPAVQGAD